MLTNDAEFLCAIAKILEAGTVAALEPEWLAKRLRLIARKLPQTREWAAPAEWGTKAPSTDPDPRD